MVLDSIKENFIVDRASLVTPEQITEFDEMMQIKYRFINQKFSLKKPSTDVKIQLQPV